MKATKAKWTQLDDGSWGVYGTGFVAGDVVEVTAQSGVVSEVVIASLVADCRPGRARRATIVPRNAKEARQQADCAAEYAESKRKQAEWDAYWLSHAGRAERMFREQDPEGWMAWFGKDGGRERWKAKFENPNAGEPAIPASAKDVYLD